MGSLRARGLRAPQRARTFGAMSVLSCATVASAATATVSVRPSTNRIFRLSVAIAPAHVQAHVDRGREGQGGKGAHVGKGRYEVRGRR